MEEKIPFRKTTNKSSSTVSLCERRLDLAGGTSQSLTACGKNMEKYAIKYNATMHKKNSIKQAIL